MTYVTEECANSTKQNDVYTQLAVAIKNKVLRLMPQHFCF